MNFQDYFSAISTRNDFLKAGDEAKVTMRAKDLRILLLDAFNKGHEEASNNRPAPDKFDKIFGDIFGGRK